MGLVSSQVIYSRHQETKAASKADVQSVFPPFLRIKIAEVILVMPLRSLFAMELLEKAQ